MHIQRHRTWGSTLLALSVGILSACTQSTPTSQTARSNFTNTAASSTNLKVVATSSVLCDLTKTIAANTSDLTCLVKAGTDPHVYEPTPEDRKAIEDAQLVLYLQLRESSRYRTNVLTRCASSRLFEKTAPGAASS